MTAHSHNKNCVGDLRQCVTPFVSRKCQGMYLWVGLLLVDCLNQCLKFFLKELLYGCTHNFYTQFYSS